MRHFVTIARFTTIVLFAMISYAGCGGPLPRNIQESSSGLTRTVKAVGAIQGSTATGGSSTTLSLSHPELDTEVSGNLVIYQTKYESSSGNIVIDGGTQGNYEALSIDLDAGNVYVGVGTFVTSNTGVEEVGVGFGALAGGPAGNQNTAVGYQAMTTEGASQDGTQNVAVGYLSMKLNTSGGSNVAVGSFSLEANTATYGNVAVGASALAALDAGQGDGDPATNGYNTAVGNNAMVFVTTGLDNVAVGQNALGNTDSVSTDTAVGSAALENDTGGGNVAVGSGTLAVNSSGIKNVGVGANALGVNTTGQNNTAVGYDALAASATVNGNVGIGMDALLSTTGEQNTGVGTGVMNDNTSGTENVAVGWSALYDNTSGSSNIAIGYNAGNALTTGSDNIAIGNSGAAGDSDHIWIGTQGTQLATFVAGIYGSAIGTYYVCVDSSGQLGVGNNCTNYSGSSRRFKHDIDDIGEESRLLMGLRPVRFRYNEEFSKDDSQHYGLLAEEVEQIAPQLVTRDKEGRVDGVKYDLVNALMLNEVQRLNRENEAQKETISKSQSAITTLQDQVASLQVQRQQDAATLSALVARFDAIEQQSAK